MTVSLQELELEARQLPPAEREGLINRLLATFDEEPLSQVDKAWLEEADRRRHQLRTGQRMGIPASEAFDSIRRELGWKR